MLCSVIYGSAGLSSMTISAACRAGGLIILLHYFEKRKYHPVGNHQKSNDQDTGVVHPQQVCVDGEGGGCLGREL